MNYLGIDYGQKRVGLSVCYDNVMIALPMPAIILDDDAEKIAKISEIIRNYKISVVAIGYPINMDGTVGNKAKEVDEFIEKLSGCVGDSVKIYRVDERLTSEQANNDAKTFYSKQSATKKRKQRKSGVIDSQAATIILQDFLYELALTSQH